MTEHVRPETSLTSGITTLVLPDGRRVSADAVPRMLEALEQAERALLASVPAFGTLDSHRLALMTVQVVRSEVWEGDKS